MICSHFFRSQAKLELVGAVDAPARARSLEHHHRAARRAAPALLRRGDQHVDAGGLHVDPHRARGDAVEHEQAADFVHRGGRPRAGSRPAGSCRDAVSTCGANTSVGLLGADRRRDFGDRRRRQRRLRAVADAARLAARSTTRGIRPMSKIWRPAVAEPAVAQHQHVLAAGELARHGLHAEGAAAGHERPPSARWYTCFSDGRDVAA